MVSYSVASMFFHEYTIPEIFMFVSKSGLDGMEFWLETPHFWLRDMPVQEVVACRNGHPELKTFTVHAPVLDLNPCSLNPEVAEVSVAYTVRSLALAGQMGAGVLTVHPGRRTAKRPPGEADVARFSHYIDVLREAAKRDSIRVCMENMEPAVNALVCTPERMRELLDDEPWLSFTLDVAHALSKSEEEPLTYIELCHDRLVNVHISRTEAKVLHLPLAESPVIANVLEALREAGFDGSLTLEIEDLNLGRPYTSTEKIALLAQDCAFMHRCME
jgi:sugar phosphate isomerase/epimerase